MPGKFVPCPLWNPPRSASHNIITDILHCHYRGTWGCLKDTPVVSDRVWILKLDWEWNTHSECGLQTSHETGVPDRIKRIKRRKQIESQPLFLNDTGNTSMLEHPNAAPANHSCHQAFLTQLPFPSNCKPEQIFLTCFLSGIWSQWQEK